MSTPENGVWKDLYLLVDLQAAARNCSSLEDSYRIGRNLEFKGKVLVA